MENIPLVVELQPEEAEALAQLLKRISFDVYRALAINDDEAYVMRYAWYKVQTALADKGFSPR